jgi:hypothetical protein
MKEPENLYLVVIQQVYAELPNAHGMPLILFYKQTGPLAGPC